MNFEKKDISETTYYVQGMHCASCEVLIEKKMLKQKGVKTVEASTKKGELRVEFAGKKLRTNELNQIFKGDHYSFSTEPIIGEESKLFKYDSDGKLLINQDKLSNLLYILGISLLLIIGYILLSNSGLSSLITVNSTSSLPAFFIFGLLAGVSSCAALVGGIVLSMSKQWSEIYGSNDSFGNRIQPTILFNIERLLSFLILGGVLGSIGKLFNLSLAFTSILTIAVSVMMLALALQMLGVKAFQKFQVTTPKFISRYVANEDNFKGRYMPFMMGALTFFLPCGFTITAQGLALTSGNIMTGALIMFFFALGTLPMLALIGISATEFTKRPHLSAKFLKIAGVLVFFFALYNINAQLNVLGLSSFSDLSTNVSKKQDTQISDNSDLPEIVDGKQVLKIVATSSGYTPNYLKVRAGIPVRWEIEDKGTSGCTNAIISNSLFEGQIALTPGETSVKEFTPEKPGKYKFSCWMGMVSGVIEVISSEGSSNAITINSDSNEVVPSGAKGCGCGGGGSCGGTQN